MISRDLILNVGYTSASLNQPLTLYMYDRDILLNVEVRGYDFRFGATQDNLIGQPNIVKAKTYLKSPSGEIFTYPMIETEIDDNKIKIMINNLMTDESSEIGTYEVQIQLIDEDGSSIHLHPFNFFVRDLIARTDDYEFDYGDNSNTHYPESYVEGSGIISSDYLNKIENDISYLYSEEFLMGKEIKDYHTEDNTTIGAINELVSNYHELNAYYTYLLNNADKSVPYDTYINYDINNKASLLADNTSSRIEDIELVNEEHGKYINVGEYYLFRWNVTPNNSYKFDVHWTSSQPSVAVVNSTGKVLGKSEGWSDITVRSRYDEKVFKTFRVFVGDYHPMTSLLLSPINLRMEIGKTESIAYTIKPYNSTQTEVLYDIDGDKKSVYVVHDKENKKFVVTGLDNGTCNITVYSKDNPSKKSVCKITIGNGKYLKDKSISINKPEKTKLEKGESINLTCNVSPSNLNVLWTSSRPEILEVDSTGKVTAVSKGFAKIICSIEGYEEVSNSILFVCVEESERPYLIIDNSNYEFKLGDVLTIGALSYPDEDVELEWSLDDRAGDSDIVEAIDIIDDSNPLYNKHMLRLKALNIGRITVSCTYFVITGYSEDTGAPIFDKITDSSQFIITADKDTIKIINPPQRIEIDEPVLLRCNVYPESLVTQIKWKSSNTEIATVSKNGYVRPKGLGLVTITAYIPEKDFPDYAIISDSVTILVCEEIDTVIINRDCIPENPMVGQYFTVNAYTFPEDAPIQWETDYDGRVEIIKPNVQPDLPPGVVINKRDVDILLAKEGIGEIECYFFNDEGILLSDTVEIDIQPNPEPVYLISGRPFVRYGETAQLNIRGVNVHESMFTVSCKSLSEGILEIISYNNYGVFFKGKNIGVADIEFTFTFGDIETVITKTVEVCPLLPESVSIINPGNLSSLNETFQFEYQYNPVDDPNTNRQTSRQEWSITPIEVEDGDPVIDNNGLLTFNDAQGTFEITLNSYIYDKVDDKEYEYTDTIEVKMYKYAKLIIKRLSIEEDVPIINITTTNSGISHIYSEAEVLDQDPYYVLYKLPIDTISVRFFIQSNLTEVVSFETDILNLEYLDYMFYCCDNLRSVNSNDWNVSNVKNMYNMFSKCNSLESIDLSNWDVSNVETMTEMFYRCNSLESIDLSNWDVSNVEYMDYMFYECNSLENVNISNWHFNGNVRMDYMFGRCSNLKNVIENFEYSDNRFINAWFMFSGCTSLEKLPSCNFGSCCYNTGGMFYGCTSLEESIDLTNWCIGESMFSGCTELKIVENMDTNNIDDNFGIQHMFKDCTNLYSINKIELNDLDRIDIDYAGFVENCISLRRITVEDNSRNYLDVNLEDLAYELPVVNNKDYGIVYLDMSKYSRYIDDDCFIRLVEKNWLVYNLMQSVNIAPSYLHEAYSYYNNHEIKSATVFEDGIPKIVVQTKPGNKYWSDYKWSPFIRYFNLTSSNENVVSIDNENNRFKFVGPGEVTLRAESKIEPHINDEFKLNVIKFNENNYIRFTYWYDGIVHYINDDYSVKMLNPETNTLETVTVNLLNDTVINYDEDEKESYSTFTHDNPIKEVYINLTAKDNVHDYCEAIEISADEVESINIVGPFFVIDTIIDGSLDNINHLSFKNVGGNLTFNDGSNSTNLTNMDESFFHKEGSGPFFVSLGNLNTSNVVSMRHAFHGSCPRDIGKINVSNVKDMYAAFALNYINSNLNNPHDDVSAIFGDLNYKEILHLPIGSFIFEYGSFPFGTYSNSDKEPTVISNGDVYTSSYFKKDPIDWDVNLDVSNWDVSNVEDMSFMFFYTDFFISGIGNWDVSNVKYMSGMFAGSYDIPDISNWDVSNVKNMSCMFYASHDVPSIDISNWDVSNVEDMSGMFAGSEGVTDISNWDVSNVEDMSFMFYSNNLSLIDLSNWDVSNVEDMSFMFTNCQYVDHVGISNWDVSNVRNMQYMFNGSEHIDLDVSSWDVSNVINMGHMFSDSQFDVLDLNSWDVSSVKNMNSIFAGCNINELDISRWDVSSVTDMSYMFSNNRTDVLDLSSWDVSSTTDMSYMFAECNINELDLSNWNCVNITDNRNMFYTATINNLNISGWGISMLPEYIFNGLDIKYIRSLDADVDTINAIITALPDRKGKEPGTLDVTIVKHSVGLVNLDLLKNKNWKMADYSIFDLKSIKLEAEKYTTDTEIPVQLTYAFEPGYTNQRDIEFIVIGDANLDNNGVLTFNSEGTVEVYIKSINNPEIQSNRITITVDNSRLIKFKTVFSNNPPSGYFYVNNNRVNCEDCEFKDGVSLYRHNEPITSIKSLNTIDSLYTIEIFNTSNFTDMSSMFEGCKSLKTIESINNWDVSNVTDMNHMFHMCESLRSINLNNWDVSSVTNMSKMFSFCTSLRSININNWDVSSVTTMECMFDDCRSLKTIDLNNWDVSSVTNIGGMFAMASFSEPFSGPSLSSVYISNWDVSNVTDMRGMFLGNTKLTTLNISKWDVNNVTDMSRMFEECSSLESIDLSTWDVSNVRNMSGMFYSCQSLSSINLSTWDVNNVTDMSYMFYRCGSLRSINLSNWDVSSVTDMRSMFSFCESLSSININRWDVSSVTTMEYMFDDCRSLKTIDLNNWDVSSVTDMRGMFYSCQSLSSINLSTWDVSSVTDMRSMLYNCMKGLEITMKGVTSEFINKLITDADISRECTIYYNTIDSGTVISTELCSCIPIQE